MRNPLRLTLLLAIVLAAGLAVAEDSAKTLLGKWMTPNVALPLSSEDLDTVRKSLQLVAAKPPPAADYPKWVAISKAGAAAAAKSDVKGVKKCCKDCHDTYREKYRKEQATRPFP
jgi:hypothetical protein